MRILSDKSYNREIQAAKAEKEAELKGYYKAQEEEFASYIKILSQQIKNQLEMPYQNNVTRDALKVSYESSGAVHSIVSLIARNVGECSQFLELYDLKTGDLVEKHWLLDLLARPNDRYTPQKYMQLWATEKCVFGDVFVDAPKAVGKDRGKIREMYILPGHKVGIKHGDWDNLFEGININGKLINASEVFESFDVNLDDTSYFGYSRLAAAAIYLRILDESMGRESQSLKNGGVANIITPAASLQYPALAEDKQNAEQELNGKAAFGKNKFLRMAVDVHQLGSSPVDLNILSSHKEAVTAVCFAFGIPVDLFYGQSKYENAREAKKQIYEQCAIPMLHEFGADLLNYAGLAKDFRLVVNTDKIDVLQDNPYDVATKMTSCGAFTTNEIREAAGWEPREEAWCNEVRLPMGVQIGNESIDISEL